MKARHLNDEQFAEARAGAASHAVATHVGQCDACRAELGRVNSALGQMSAWSRAAAERPAGFWYAQRQAIAEQLGARRQPSRLLGWAAAMATMVLAASLLTQMPAPDVQRLQARAAKEAQAGEASVDADDALMAEIEASLRRPVPRAFEPALLVTQELHRAAKGAESRP